MTSNRQIAAARTIAVAIALLALCGAALLRPGFSFADQPASDIAESRPLIESGITSYEAGDYAKAVADLTRAEKLYPVNSSISLYLGLAYLKQNRLSDAIAAWQRYIKLAPSTAAEQQNDLKEKVPQYLGILREQNDRDEAERALKHEHTIGPGDPNAIAITYFRNLGSPDLTPLQKGLTALLIDDISKLPGVKVVEREQLQALLSELSWARAGWPIPIRPHGRDGCSGRAKSPPGVTSIRPKARWISIRCWPRPRPAAPNGTFRSRRGRSCSFTIWRKSSPGRSSLTSVST